MSEFKKNCTNLFRNICFKPDINAHRANYYYYSSDRITTDNTNTTHNTSTTTLNTITTILLFSWQAYGLQSKASTKDLRAYPQSQTADTPKNIYRFKPKKFPNSSNILKQSIVTCWLIPVIFESLVVIF